MNISLYCPNCLSVIEINKTIEGRKTVIKSKCTGCFLKTCFSLNENVDNVHSLSIITMIGKSLDIEMNKKKLIYGKKVKIK